MPPTYQMKASLPASRSCFTAVPYIFCLLFSQIVCSSTPKVYLFKLLRCWFWVPSKILVDESRNVELWPNIL